MRRALTILPAMFVFALNLYGQSAREHFKFAKFHFDNRDYEKAMVFINKAITADSSYVNAYFVRAQISLELGDHHSSILDINYILKTDRSKNSFTGQCHLVRGRVFMEMEKYSRARYDFDLSEQYTRGDPDVDYYRAMLNFRTGDYNGALLAVVDAIDHTSDAKYYQLKSEIKIAKYKDAPKSSEYLSVLTDINKAIALDESNYELYLFRSKYLKSVGKMDQAMNDFDKMIELSPEKDVAYAIRGIAKMNSDDYQGALVDFSESIAINPSNTDAYRHRGLCYINLNMHANANEDLSKSIDLMNNSLPQKSSSKSEAKRELAETYLLRGHSQNILGSEIQACRDFLSAYQLGVSQGLNYYRKFCSIY